MQYAEVQALSRAVAVGRSELQSCSVLQCVAVQAWSSAVCVAACVAVSCSELLCIAVPCIATHTAIQGDNTHCNTGRVEFVAANFSALQRVSVRCSELQSRRLHEPLMSLSVL